MIHSVQYWNSALLISEAVSALACSTLFGYLLDTSKSRQAVYLSSRAVLLTSMITFVIVHSVMWFIFARLLQGAATAMVFVASLHSMTEAVNEHHLCQAICYVGIAITIGSVCGPILGGIIFNLGGLYAFSGVIFGIITLDLILRLANIEKRVAVRWTNTPYYPLQNEFSFPTNPFLYEIMLNGDRTLQNFKSSASFALSKLLPKPRILISLWAMVVNALIMSAFDAVSGELIDSTLTWADY